MADFSSFLTKYFKFQSFEGTGPVTLTLAKVELEEVGPDKDRKPVAYFVEDPRGLVLSAQKYDLLAKTIGSRDTDKWIGAKVILSGDPTVKFAGRVVGGVGLATAK